MSWWWGSLPPRVCPTTFITLPTTTEVQYMKMKYRVTWRRILWGVNADRVPAEDQALIDWAHSLLPAAATDG